jgi:hypothetical protein
MSRFTKGLMVGIISLFLLLGLYALGAFLWSLWDKGLVVAPFDPAIWFIIAFALAGILRMLDMDQLKIR